MKDAKREMILYSFYDRTHIERHLAQMAGRGWLLDQMGSFGWVYRRVEPQKLTFSVCYYPKASPFDPEPSEGQREFIDFCERTGWKLAASSGQLQAFCNEREDPVPIETDPVLELEAIHKSAKRTYVPVYGMLLVCAVFYLLSTALSLRSDPIGFFSRPSSLSSMISESLLFLNCAVELIGYFLWRGRAKRAAGRGEFLATPDHSRFQLVTLALILLSFLYMLAGAVFSGSPLLRVLTTFVIAYIALMHLAVNGTKELLKRKKVPAKANLAATIGADALMGAVMLAAIFFLLSNYSSARGILSIDQTGAAPLTVDGLLPVDPERYTLRCYGDESFLLGEYHMYQMFRTGTLASGDPVPPHLNYTLTLVKAPFLYGWCKQRLLSRYEDPDYDWGVSYQGVDAAPWGAREAYRLVDRDGEAGNGFLLCYESSIVEFSPSWEPTAEQMTRVGAAFG